MLMNKFRKEDWLTNVPLYAVNGIVDENLVK